MLPIGLTIAVCSMAGVAHLFYAAARPQERGAHAACAVALFLTAASCAVSAAGLPIGGAS